MAQGDEEAVRQPLGKAFTLEHTLFLGRVICLPGMGIFMSQRANQRCTRQTPFDIDRARLALLLKEAQDMLPGGPDGWRQTLMASASDCQFPGFNYAQDGDVLDISIEYCPGLLDDHLIKRLDGLIVQHHRLGALTAAILPARKLAPVRAKWRSTNMTGRALLGTGDAVGFGRVAKAIKLADNRFMTRGAAG
jgi:hypothetical protein